jgi:cupin fold WbuC family metalloprotein
MLIDDKLLNKISEEAKDSPKFRINYNLHESLDDKVQRLLNAMEPGTIIPIQRHLDTADTILVLRGMLKITLYDDDRNIVEQYGLNPLNGKYGCHIPKGVWYGVEVLAPNTVMFEAKEGLSAPLVNENVMK